MPIDMYSVSDWQTKVPVKEVSGSIPLVCYDDQGFPNRTLNFWPIPNQANNVRIYSLGLLAQAATLATPIAFPPGYAEAFRYNLAIRLKAEFAPEKQLDPTVAALAIESLARVKTMNLPDLEMRSDLVPSGDGYNWSADLFGNPFQ